MRTYYKHKIDRKDEFIGVLKKYLSPECIREIPYLSKRPGQRKHILLFALLDMSYEDEVLSFSGQIMRDVSEITIDEPPAIKTAVFKYDPVYIKNKEVVLQKKKEELKRWLKNPEDFIETYEPRDEISDEVLLEKEKRGIQHILVKDGQFLNVYGGVRGDRDSTGYSYMFIKDYDFSHTQVRKFRTKKGIEIREVTKFYKKDGNDYYSWRDAHTKNLRLTPSPHVVGFFYYEGKPNYRIELNKETYYKYKGLADIK